MTVEAKLDELRGQLDALDADSLVLCLHYLVARKGQMGESVRRALMRTVTVRLAAVVLDGGFVPESN